MGFEQLAALKEQLAMQAKIAAPAPKKAPKGNTPQPPQAGSADPVVIAISRLQRRFPNAFPKNPAPKIPLKVGILKDIYLHSKELRLSEDEIKQAIKTWCESRRYWACMTEAAVRIDLQGEPAGAVTAQEALRAKRLSRGPQREGRRRTPAAARSKEEKQSADQPADQPSADPVTAPEAPSPEA